MPENQLHELILPPGISASSAITTIIPPAGVEAGVNLPLEGTRSGQTFNDRFNPNLRWYLPSVSLVPSPDPDFSFTAGRLGVGSGGNPFDTVELTFGILVSVPSDVTAARTADPSLVFKPASTISNLEVTLTLSSVADDGSPKQTPYPMTVTSVESGGSVDTQARVTAKLQGPAVIVLFENLRTSGSATLTVAQSYRVWRQVRTGPWRFPHPFPNIPDDFQQIGGANGIPQQMEMTSALRPDPSLDDGTGLPGPAPQKPTVGTGEGPGIQFHPPVMFPPQDPPDDPWPPALSFVQAQDTEPTVLPVGTAFAGNTLRAKYTITDAGVTRPIIDVKDLVDFQTVRSEFRELTSLGSVNARYPSIRALYVGQVSGIVIAVPAQYAIARGSLGCAARCQAVVDGSPTTLSGCRFELDFKLIPNVDPADITQLTTDLADTPESQSMPLHVALPTGIDSRTPPTFTGISAATPTLVDDVAGAMVVGIALTDEGPTPAITNVNLLLHALTATTVPITGEVAVRLDDAYPQPVTTSIVLSLRTTAGTDDIAVTVSPQNPTQLTVTNVSPLAERLSAVISIGGVPSHEDLDVTLAPSASTTIQLPNGQTNGIVRSQLLVPDPMPVEQIFSFVSLDLQTISQLQHPLEFNATAIDFTAADLTQINLLPRLTDLPSLNVSALTLTPDHRIDSVNVAVPITAAIVDLSATVSLTATHRDGKESQTEISHDFLSQPVLVLTPAQLR